MTQTEQECREVAAQFPTPNVLKGLALAEAGRITFAQLYKLYQEALSAGLEAVT